MPDSPAASLVVLITGASSGIGRATAHEFADRGASLVLAARSIPALEETASECADRAETLVVSTDVSDGDAVDALFEAAVSRFGRVDAVVHSAAVAAYGEFEKVPADVFERVIAVNVMGTGNVARTALRQFDVQGGGHLVILGSVLGKMVTPFMSPYVTSKWAIHGLTRTLQAEVRQLPGVEITLVSPGSVDTPVYARAANYLGRVGRPPPPIASAQRVARAVVQAVESPRREISVGVFNPLVVLGFRAVPGVFDLLVTPLMRFAGVSREQVPPNPGNVFDPDSDHDVAG